MGRWYNSVGADFLEIIFGGDLDVNKQNYGLRCMQRKRSNYLYLSYSKVILLSNLQNRLLGAVLCLKKGMVDSVYKIC